MKRKINFSSKRIKVIIFCIPLFLSFSQTLATAAVNKLPAPTIGTLLGFYPNGKYSAISSGGNTSLLAGESIVDYSLNVVYLDAGETVNSPCGTADNGTVIANVFGISTPQNSGRFMPLLANWTNPANSELRIVCAYSTYTIKNAAGAISYLKSPISYATILPSPSTSASPSPSTSASPSPSVVSEVVAPSGSKPSVSGTPVEGNKFKVSIKAWNMNGNEFLGRQIYMKLCGDSKCNNVINSWPVVATGTINFDETKTLTMSKVVGKAGQFVQFSDTMIWPYQGSPDADLTEDSLVELFSSIKKIESESVTSNSSSATETATEESVQLESDTNATQVAQDSKSSSQNMIILIFGITIAIILITLITILSKRRNSPK